MIQIFHGIPRDIFFKWCCGAYIIRSTTRVQSFICQFPCGLVVQHIFNGRKLSNLHKPHQGLLVLCSPRYELPTTRHRCFLHGTWQSISTLRDLSSRQVLSRLRLILTKILPVASNLPTVGCWIWYCCGYWQEFKDKTFVLISVVSRFATNEIVHGDSHLQTLDAAC